MKRFSLLVACLALTTVEMVCMVAPEGCSISCEDLEKVSLDVYKKQFIGDLDTLTIAIHDSLQVDALVGIVLAYFAHSDTEFEQEYLWNAIFLAKKDRFYFDNRFYTQTVWNQLRDTVNFEHAMRFVVDVGYPVVLMGSGVSASFRGKRGGDSVVTHSVPIASQWYFILFDIAKRSVVSHYRSNVPDFTYPIFRRPTDSAGTVELYFCGFRKQQLIPKNTLNDPFVVKDVIQRDGKSDQVLEFDAAMAAAMYKEWLRVCNRCIHKVSSDDKRFNSLLVMTDACFGFSQRMDYEATRWLHNNSNFCEPCKHLKKHDTIQTLYVGYSGLFLQYKQNGYHIASQTSLFRPCSLWYFPGGKAPTIGSQNDSAIVVRQHPSPVSVAYIMPTASDQPMQNFFPYSLFVSNRRGGSALPPSIPAQSINAWRNKLLMPTACVVAGSIVAYHAYRRWHTIR